MYPLLLYVAIRTWGVRAGVGLLLLLLVPRLLRLRLHRRRELSTVLVQLGAIGALSGLAFVLNDSEARALITDRRKLAGLVGFDGEAPELAQIVALDIDDAAKEPWSVGV